MTDAAYQSWLISFVRPQLAHFAGSVVVVRQGGQISCASSSPGRARSVCSLPDGQGRPSQVPAPGLLPLDRLEKRLEVSLAEPLRAVPLDQLEEHGRPVLDRLGEDL